MAIITLLIAVLQWFGVTPSFLAAYSDYIEIVSGFIGTFLLAFVIGRRTKPPQIKTVYRTSPPEPIPSNARRLILEFETTSDQAYINWGTLKFESANDRAKTIEGNPGTQFWRPDNFYIHLSQSAPDHPARVIVDANFSASEGVKQQSLKLVKTKGGYAKLRVFDPKLEMNIGQAENALQDSDVNEIDVPLDWRS